MLVLKSSLIHTEMFQYSEEFDFSLDLVKKCGDVIKKAFYSEKKIRYESATLFGCFSIFT